MRTTAIAAALAVAAVASGCGKHNDIYVTRGDALAALRSKPGLRVAFRHVSSSGDIIAGRATDVRSGTSIAFAVLIGDDPGPQPVVPGAGVEGGESCAGAWFIAGGGRGSPSARVDLAADLARRIFDKAPEAHCGP